MTILTPTTEPVRARSVGGHAPEPSWQAEIKAAIRDPRTLCERLGLPAKFAQAAKVGAGQFPVFVPSAYLARIKHGDPSDPLLRQVLPLAEEGSAVPGFVADPVGDSAAQKAPGLLHKYQGRVLLITTGVCAVHCRYCFRRNYPYETIPHSDKAWGAAIRTIATDASIHEVVLSGGDPLMLVDERLLALIQRLEAIDHIKRLRIHTRLPMMVPSRVTESLLAIIAESRLKSIIVWHANHAQELDNETASAADKLGASGAVLLNQAVLLRGVNDSADAQCDLSERLIEQGVTPYYLHQLDRVDGAAHFEVSEDRGREIIAQMRERLPGYLVPRYVKELPGKSSKSMLL